MRILIVDDNDRYANNLKAFFDARKIETVRAYNAKEGWEAISPWKHKPPDYF